MLSTLFGKKSDHPLADVKTAQALLDDLPKNDAHKSLTELIELLESLFSNADFKVDHQFILLRLLDEAAQPFVRKLAREYFTPFEINKFQENRLWLALSSWSEHIAQAYIKIFTDYCNGEKGSGAIKSQLPLLTARAVHATMWQIKFICSRYGQVDNLIWVNLGHLYRHAESQKYLDTPVTLYPGIVGYTSVKSELCVLLVWYDTGLAALSPLYIHLNERILAQYRSAIDIHNEVAQHSRISFDLSRSAEPSRINMGATTHPSMRFIGLSAIQAKLDDLMKVLKKNIVPTDLNLGGSYEADVVKQSVQYLLNYAIAPPVRRSTRRTANVTLSVVTGLDKVIKHAGGSAQPSETPARWMTEEISATGFSSIIPAKGSEDIGIGSLLGMQPEGMLHWGVSVVRQLLRDDANQLRVGAQILSAQIVCVTLNQNRVPGGTVEHGQLALWLLAKQDDTTGTAQLLLKADTYFPGRSIQVQLKGRNYLLMPNDLIERGLDYDLAKFRFIVQEADLEEA